MSIYYIYINIILSALRSVTKLCSNVLFGSLAENSWRRQTVIITDRLTLFQFLTDKQITIKFLTMVGEDTLLINYHVNEDMVQALAHTSIVHAMMITAYGRMILYGELEKIGLSRVLYCDTDSIISVTREDEYSTPKGSGPGAWTDALEDEYGSGTHAQKFVATGAKSYALDVVSGEGELLDYHISYKGISQTSSTLQELNFDCILDNFLTSHKQNPIKITNDGIFRSCQVDSGDLTSRTLNDNSSITLPYGHHLQAVSHIDNCFE